MRTIFLCGLLAGGLLTGCTTKKQAQLQAQSAYIAGQREAMAQLQTAQTAGPDIIVRGPVAHPRVPWSEGLTLAQAIAAAGYQARQDPRSITVYRQSQSFPVNVRELLRRHDVPLEEGDVIELR